MRNNHSYSSYRYCVVVLSENAIQCSLHADPSKRTLNPYYSIEFLIINQFLSYTVTTDTNTAYSDTVLTMKFAILHSHYSKSDENKLYKRVCSY